jgi:hypothetical protein
MRTKPDEQPCTCACERCKESKTGKWTRAARWLVPIAINVLVHLPYHLHWLGYTN